VDRGIGQRLDRAVAARGAERGGDARHPPGVDLVPVDPLVQAGQHRADVEHAPLGPRQELAVRGPQPALVAFDLVVRAPAAGRKLLEI
jgi:hypothetical protein